MRVPLQKCRCLGLVGMNRSGRMDGRGLRIGTIDGGMWILVAMMALVPMVAAMESVERGIDETLVT